MIHGGVGRQTREPSHDTSIPFVNAGTLWRVFFLWSNYDPVGPDCCDRSVGDMVHLFGHVYPSELQLGATLSKIMEREVESRVVLLDVAEMIQRKALQKFLNNDRENFSKSVWVETGWLNILLDIVVDRNYKMCEKNQFWCGSLVRHLFRINFALTITVHYVRPSWSARKPVSCKIVIRIDFLNVFDLQFENMNSIILIYEVYAGESARAGWNTQSKN